jgi:hypothetical protein
MKPAWIALLLAALCGPSWAVVKCQDAKGKVTYQETLCPEALQTQPIATLPHAPHTVTLDPALLSMEKDSSPAITPAIPPAASTAPPALPAPTSNAKTGLEPEGDMCLEYLKPLLKDPGSPYYRNLQKDGTVLSMELFAKNTLGGYTSKPAACEIKNGRLDDGWTKIHLKRLGWAIP